MKLYLLCEIVDLGYHVVGVYRNLESIPGKLEPVYSYQYLGTAKEIKTLIPNKWAIVDNHNQFVSEQEVKE